MRLKLQHQTGSYETTWPKQRVLITRAMTRQAMIWQSKRVMSMLQKIQNLTLAASELFFDFLSPTRHATGYRDG